MADYTLLKNEDIETILKQYDLGDLNSATPLSGGQANSSYRLSTTRGRYTLSVCDEKTTEEVHTLTRVLTHLEVHNFPATRLVSPINNNKFITFNDRPVYIKQYLEGEVVRKIDGPMLEQVGDAIGQLHALPTPEYLPTAVVYGLDHFEEIRTADISHPFKGWLMDKKNWLESELDLTMVRGLIHGDIFWDNLLFDKGKLTALLDFEEVCQYFLLYDLGMAAVGCCSSEGSFNAEKITWLLKGYQKRHPMAVNEKAQFIPFLAYAATTTAFWRFRQYNLRYPDSNLAKSYKEMVALADQAPALRL